MLHRILQFVSTIISKLLFLPHNVKYGKNLQIHGLMYAHGKGSIVIGDNVVINSGNQDNTTAGESHCHFSVSSGKRLFIGNNVGISHCAISVQNDIQIDDNVFIGSGCMITDTDFHALTPEMRQNHTQPNTAPVHIKKNAFIGARCIILKGVTIGEGSVVGGVL